MVDNNSFVFRRSKGLISIIIPTLNEQYGIEKTISSIFRSGLSDPKKDYALEILVVDGGSSDLTVDVAKKMGAKVIIEKEKGFGKAVKAGFAQARGDIIVTLDADNTYPAEFLTEYIEHLKEKDADFISINRFAGMENGAMHFTHRLGNKILTTLINFSFSVHIKDSQSGMCIMKKSFLSNINLRSDSFALAEEIKIIAFTFFHALELDGKHYKKRIGTSKLSILQDGFANLAYLFLYHRYLKFAIKSSPPILLPESIEHDDINAPFLS
jgi:dolichol-phosphate hexosyltransferase